MIISRGGFAYFSIASGVGDGGEVCGRFPRMACFQSLDFSKCVDRASLLLGYGRQVRGGLSAWQVMSPSLGQKLQIGTRFARAKARTMAENGTVIGIFTVRPDSNHTACS